MHECWNEFGVPRMTYDDYAADPRGCARRMSADHYEGNYEPYYEPNNEANSVFLKSKTQATPLSLPTRTATVHTNLGGDPGSA